MTKILNYSDDDFPSLDSGTRRKKVSVEVSCSSNWNCAPAAFNERVSENCDSEAEVERSGMTEIDLRAAKIERKTWNKVLKPNKHKETFTIKIEDILMTMPGKLTTKSKPRLVKHTKNRELLSGNRLDADNPVRLKGIITLLKKPKRLSKTKSFVLSTRQSEKKAKELAAGVSIDGEIISFNSVVSTEKLWQAMYHGKLPEVRKMLANFANNSPPVESQELVQSSSIDRNSAAIETSDLCDYLNQNQTKIDALKKLESLDDCERKEVLFRDVLGTSTIPLHELLIHHHNFKRYCDNCLTSELNKAAEALISQIVRFQYNKYQRNPVKAVADKRYVLGLKQVKKFTKLNRVKLIICVPDMEDCMCDPVEELKSLASAYCIPCVFAFTRRRLGFLTYKKVGVCCFGLLDYCGAEVNFTKTMEAAAVAKKMYKEKCSSAIKYCKLHFGDLVVNEAAPDIDESIINDLNQKLTFNTENETISNTPHITD